MPPLPPPPPTQPPQPSQPPHSSQPPPLPQTIPGPLVHGRPTTVTLQTIAQLASDPTLAARLPPLINASYGTAVRANPHLGFSAGDRVPSPAAFFEQMGSHRETFVLTLAYATATATAADADADADDDNAKLLLATATARRHLRHEPPADSWMWPAAPTPGVCEWELKLLATEPRTQRQGVAGWVLATMERVMVERSGMAGVVPVDDYDDDDDAEVDARSGAGTPTQVRVVLTTARELNEAWYVKRGYVLDAARHPGGDGVKFTVADMSKVIGVVPG